MASALTDKVMDMATVVKLVDDYEEKWKAA